MNQELEKQLARALEKSLELAEKTGELVIEQGGELLNQFYLWETTKNSVIVFASFLGLFLFWFLPNKWSNKERKDSDCQKVFGRYVSNDNGAIMMILFRGPCFILTALILCVRIMVLVKVLIAPKLYLIDYFTK